MPVQIRVDGIDVPERALIELLQDRVLDPLVALDRAQRLGEGVHDRRGRERIGRGLHLRTPEQIANRPVELEQLVVAQVLDHTDDVSRHDRLVHRDGVDQRELACIEGGEVGFLDRIALDARVDLQAQLLFEFSHQARTFGPEHLARVEVE